MEIVSRDTVEFQPASLANDLDTARSQRPPGRAHRETRRPPGHFDLRYHARALRLLRPLRGEIRLACGASDATCVRRRRTSVHGTATTSPEFNPANRVSISLSHAASAPSSTTVSKLSSKEPAEAAQASGGRASAFFRSSATSRASYRHFTLSGPRSQLTDPGGPGI